MWLTDVNIVDTTTGLTNHTSIRIEDGLIAEINGHMPPGVSSESVGGAYALPGLISCHTHLQGIWPHSLRDERENPSKTVLRAAWQARRTLAAGITTVRCVHEQSAVDVVLRDAIAAGLAHGPTILASGRGLTTPGGHGDGFGCRQAKGYDGFREAGHEELRLGADQIKIYASGGLAKRGESVWEPEMSVAEMRGAVEAAEQHETYVVAHASASKVIGMGLQAGVRSFEHGYELDASTAEMMADRGAFLTPTLVVTHAKAWMSDRGFGPEAIDRSKSAGQQHLESAATAHRAGVRIVMGTDFSPAGLDDGVSLAVREMELLVKAGLTPLEAIRAATVNAAELIRRPELGRIEVGNPADIVLVKENPIRDIAAMEEMLLVMKAGIIVGGQGSDDYCQVQPGNLPTRIKDLPLEESRQ